MRPRYGIRESIFQLAKPNKNFPAPFSRMHPESNWPKQLTTHTHTQRYTMCIVNCLSSGCIGAVFHLDAKPNLRDNFCQLSTRERERGQQRFGWPISKPPVLPSKTIPECVLVCLYQRVCVWVLYWLVVVFHICNIWQAAFYWSPIMAAAQDSFVIVMYRPWWSISVAASWTVKLWRKIVGLNECSDFSAILCFLMGGFAKQFDICYEHFSSKLVGIPIEFEQHLDTQKWSSLI